MAGQQALLPMLVPQNLLARAMALSTVVQQVCVIVGPALGGLLFATGINALYLTCAALFCTSAVMYALIRYDYVAPPREPVTTDSVLAGLRFVWSHPLLLGGISLDLFAVLFGGATALLPVYAKELLHVGPQGLGLLRSAPAVGALAVGLVLSRRAIGNGVGKSCWLRSRRMASALPPSGCRARFCCRLRCSRSRARPTRSASSSGKR
nr:MFS transporter [Burkholderia multivorans]